MDIIVSQLRSIILQLGFLPIVLFSTLISLFVYWKSSRASGKNQNSIFDGYLFSSILMVIWGRITYVLTNPVDYEGLIWSWIPYEKYSDGLYVFRLLPWRWFRVWDGEFLFTGLFIGFILGATFFTLAYKRWRWREMMGTIVFTASIYLGILLILSGFAIEDPKIFNQGLVMLIISYSYVIISNFFVRTFKLRNPKLSEYIGYYTTFFFSIIVSFYIPSSLLASEITAWDRNNLLIFCGFSVISHIIFIIDVFRKNVKIKTEYRTRSVSISTNQPIKI